MSRRKDRQRAQADIIYRSGVPVSASAWERQRLSAKADLEAAAKKGMNELGRAFAVIGRAAGGFLTISYLRDLQKVARKHGSKKEE